MGILTAGEKLQTVGLAEVGVVGLLSEALGRASAGISDIHHTYSERQAQTCMYGIILTYTQKC